MSNIFHKDAPLDATIQKAACFLSELGLDLRVDEFKNPAKGLWSVNVKDSKCSVITANGKGVTKEAAHASALCELIERLCMYDIFSEYACAVQGDLLFNKQVFVDQREDIKTKLLSDELWRHYDPYNEVGAEDLISALYTNEDRIPAISFKRLSGDADVFFPVNLVDTLYVTNGMSAGNTASEARTQALCEIMERFVMFKVLRENISLPVFSDDDLSGFENALQFKDTYLENGLKLNFFDASLGGRFPVVCAVVSSMAKGGCYLSFASHPSLRIAFDRAVSEIMQGRSFQDETHLRVPVHNHELVCDENNLEEHFVDGCGAVAWKFFLGEPDFAFNPIDEDMSTQEEELFLRGLIEDAGYQIYLTESLKLPLYTCRIIIPGMSEIYPVTDLKDRNRNYGLALRNVLKSYINGSKTVEDVSAVLDLKEYAEEVPLAEYIGIPADENEFPVTVGELKCAIGFDSKDYDFVSSCIDWMGMSGIRQGNRTEIYQLLKLWIDQGREWQDYQKRIELYFSRESVALVNSLISGEKKLIDYLITENELFQSDAIKRMRQVFKSVSSANN